ncbi:hypothetical protein BGZ96_011290 [Linnemannia gamsii]|uniref:F-box domain-containing protein n=1 Tax=Linnemannia gamsii TaxID=64522 RepID=A0ABQ7JTC3_9FUNG|nr:hypothetical protein BGZ96_011290 [Linnemannia gamsii]
MVLLPEILSQVSLYLDNESLFACTAVCREWRNIFSPYFWRDVDQTDFPFWWRFLKSTPIAELASLLSSYKNSIRSLRLLDITTVSAALEANLAGIHHLCVGYDRMETHEDYERYYEGDDLSTDAVPGFSVWSPLPTEWDEMIPRAAFQEYKDEDSPRLNVSRAFWRTIQANSGLRQLIIDEADLSEFARIAPGKRWPSYSGALTPAADSFLERTFSKLQSLLHLDVGMHIEDFLLSKLAVLLPNLESFVHSSFPNFDSISLSSTLHHNLRILAFSRCSIDQHQLRSIVKAFPALEDLSVDVFPCGLAAAETIEYEQEGILEHTSLQKLVIRNCYSITSISGVGVRFPTARTVIIDRGEDHRIDEDMLAIDLLQQLMDAFPILDYLEANYICWQEDLVAEAQEPDRLGYPLIVMVFFCKDRFPADHTNLSFLISRLPFLVRLELGEVGGTVLNMIADTCKALVYTRFNIKGCCSCELCNLLTECSMLKECLGSGHVVMAEDVVNGPEWTCLGIEKLNIVVQFDMDWAPAYTEGKVGIRFVGRSGETTFSEEKDTLEWQREAAYSIVRQVYARIGRLKNLIDTPARPLKVEQSEAEAGGAAEIKGKGVTGRVPTIETGEQGQGGSQGKTEKVQASEQPMAGEATNEGDDCGEAGCGEGWALCVQTAIDLHFHNELSQSWNDNSDNIMKEINIVITQHDYIISPELSPS